MKRLLQTRSLTLVNTVICTVLILICVVSLMASTYVVLTRHIQSTVYETQQTNLRTAAAFLDRSVSEINADFAADGKINSVTLSRVPTFSDHAVIDEIGTVTGETATVFIWDEETQDFWRRTTNITKPDGSRAVGTPLGQNGTVYPYMVRGETYIGEAVILGTPYYTIYEPIRDAAGEVRGILYVGVEKAKLQAVLVAVETSMIIVALTVMVLCGALGTFLFRATLRPIPNLATVMRELAEGKTDITVPHQDWTNEIGAMSQAVDVFRQNARERDQLEVDRESEIAARGARQDLIDAAIDRFSEASTTALDAISKAGGDLEVSAQQMSMSAKNSSQLSSSVANSAEQASGNVQTVATAAEELSSSINEISRQIAQSADMSKEAVSAAESTSGRVRELADTAQSITAVVSLISDIAEQTNLLSLTATI